MVPNSSSDNEDEDENGDEEEKWQANDIEASTPAIRTSTNEIFSKFTKVSRHFAELMEQHREDLLMTKKSAPSTLIFNLPPPPKPRKRPTPCSPRSSAAEIISATKADEDCKLDSRASQSSRTIAFACRKKLLLLVPPTRMNPPCWKCRTHRHRCPQPYVRMSTRLTEQNSQHMEVSKKIM